MLRSVALLILCCLLEPLSAQFNLVGDAVPLGADCVRLTPNIGTQAGAAWGICQLDVSQPFSFDLTVNLGTNDGGADGIAWLLQQQGGCADNPEDGGGLGYNSDPPFFNPSIIIEFDTWSNGQFGDPWYDHVALQRDGSANHTGTSCLAGCTPNTIQASASNANIEDGIDHDVLIEWDPTTMTLRMEFDGVERISSTVDLVDDVFAGNPMVWWGFTGSTGGANNNQSFCLIDYNATTNCAQGIPGLTTNPQDPNMCIGEIIAISVSADAGWNPFWEATGTSSIGVAQPGDYVVSATDPSGCTITDVVTVDASAAPNLSSPSPVVLCDGESTVLTATAAPGSNISWDGSGAPTLLVDATGQHTVSASLATCTEQLTIEVIAQAIPTLSLDPGTDLVLCDGQSQLVSATTDIPANITWYQNGVALNGDDQLITGSGNWIIEAEQFGCEATPLVLQAEFLPLPGAAVSSIPDILCWNSTGLVYAVPQAGTTVLDWILPSGTPATNQAGPGTYTAILVEDNGCTSNVLFNLEMLPAINFSLDGPDGACIGETVVLTVSGNQETLEWSTGETTAAIQLSATDGSGPFEVEVGLNGCTQSAEQTVAWWPVPSVGNLADTVIRCVLDPAVEWTWPAQADAPVGWWVWSVNGLTTIDGPEWEDEGEYVVRVLDSMTGCADSTTVVVDVWPNIEVDAAPMQGIVCWDATTEVFAELRAVGPTSLDEIPYTWGWDDPELEGLNPSVPAGLYVLYAENACGQDAAVVQVEQEYCGCDMWVPTAFTPDNDGINDGFKVETNCPELDAFSFQVYDRWGELVWATDDPEDVWMGEGHQAGGMSGNYFLPDGVYGFRLWWKYSELLVPHVEERRGHIQLMR